MKLKDNCEICKKSMIDEKKEYRKINMCEKCYKEPSSPYKGVMVGGVGGLYDLNDRDSAYYENDAPKPCTQLNFD
jgi:hypothetical protein